MSSSHLDAEHGVEPPKPVSAFELFFDLVFVFAFIQVTALVLAQPDAAGLGRGLVVLALLWWAWAGFAWLTNAVDTSANGPRVVLLAAMAAMLVVAVAVPTAFTSNSIFFAGAYIVVRALHVVLYAVTGQRAILRLAPGFALASALLLSGALLAGWAQVVLWLTAIAIDYGFPLVRGVHGLTVHPAHWAERYQLVVILALGETVIASGLGVVSAAERLTAPVISGIVISVAVIGGLWWAYFDRESAQTHDALTSSRGTARTYLARDAYSYLHLALVGGIVVMAAGLETAMHHPLEPLDGIFPAALGGGVAVFLAGLAATRFRRGDPPRPEHYAGAGLALATVALAYAAPAIGSLAVLAAVLFGVTVYDLRRGAAIDGTAGAAADDAAH